MFQLVLKELREANHLSQADLADQLHVVRSTVGMWESGKNHPTYAMLMKISELFHVDVQYLMQQTVTPSETSMPSCLSSPDGSYLCPGSPDTSTQHSHFYTPEGTLFTVVMPDDSMLPELHKGDLLTAKKLTRYPPPSGSLVIAKINGTVTARKLFLVSGEVVLQAVAFSYPPKVERGKLTVQSTCILGTLVSSLRGYSQET